MKYTFFKNMKVYLKYTEFLQGMHRMHFNHVYLDLLSHNLITRVLIICQVKLTQCTMLGQKCFYLQSLSPVLHNLWVLLVD